MNVLEKEVSFYRHAKDVYDQPKTIRLIDFLTGNKYVHKVENVRNEPDKKKRDNLKLKLPAITPSGIFFGAPVARGLVEHTGLICIDIDAKDNIKSHYFHHLKEYIKYANCVAYCGLSASGKGFFLIIPIQHPTRHQGHFNALQMDFAAHGIKIDPACCNETRMRSASYDPDPYINLNAETYTHTAKKTKTRKEKQSPEDLQRVVELVEAIEAGRVNIAGNYLEWIKIASALANTFKESGRELFHRISAFHRVYDFIDTDGSYDLALKYGYERQTMHTLFYLARKCGVTLNEPTTSCDTPE